MAHSISTVIYYNETRRQFDNSLGQPSAIEPIGQHIDTSLRHDQPETVYFFIGINDTDDVGKRECCKNGERHQSRFTAAFMRGILTTRQALVNQLRSDYPCM